VYSSVDSLSYSDITSVNADYTKLMADITADLSSPAMVSNPQVQTAINDFIAHDLPLIKSTAASSGADTGNQILAQTRAMETIQE
jgi:hypothetical protein